MAKTKLLIIDDSALMRKLLVEIFRRDAEIEVVGTAADPYRAWDLIKLRNPDVLTLDVEMPRMDGLTFLEKLMQSRPMPVVMVSSLTEKGAQTTLRALELGAVDFVAKPKLDVGQGTTLLAEQLVQKIKVAARAKLTACHRTKSSAPAPQVANRALIRSTHKVIAIGASTGGTEALYHVLTALPADAPGLVIVQHMPPGFTRSFAERLDRACQIRVKEARDGEAILPGHALLAPGDKHMKVFRSGASYKVRVGGGPLVNRFRPSVDVLFHSCATHLGANAVGVVLTGMGNDGAKGLLAMRSNGARTLAQDESTCVVFGMPKEAIAMGGVMQVCKLPQIAARILDAVNAASASTGASMSNCGN